MSSVKVKFTPNSVEVLGAVDDAINTWLEEACGEIESAAKRNTTVGQIGGGKTKGAWKHKVDRIGHKGVVGNPEQTAIWLELGTGEYALNGDGRKGGWYIPIGEGKGMISQEVVDAYRFKVEHGKNGMKYAYTIGMKPQRPLHNAVEKNKGKIQKRLVEILKELDE